jgi:hypothetical protein
MFPVSIHVIQIQIQIFFVMRTCTVSGFWQRVGTVSFYKFKKFGIYVAYFFSFTFFEFSGSLESSVKFCVLLNFLNCLPLLCLEYFMLRSGVRHAFLDSNPWANRMQIHADSEPKH